MQTIIIEDKTIDLKNVKRLYPAVLVKTGYEDETTEMSIEWLDTEGRGKVEVTGYGIFIITNNSEKHTFFYENRELLDEAVGKIAAQM
jgi:hypothetical protein